MTKRKRNILDKLNTLLFWKDTRITDGERYTKVRKHDFSSYFPIDHYIKKQTFPTENIYNINDFGAVANNKSIDNAAAINKAITEASKTKGTVLINGGDYTATTVFLKSNVTLFIAEGSSIIANETGIGYSNDALIFSDHAENITITGGGKIKGNGNFFGKKPVYDENMTAPGKYIDMIELRQDYRKQLRFADKSKYGSPIILKSCKNITAHNFVIENSASWSFRLDNCENIDIHDFAIYNNRNVANADGIDLCGSSNVKINHCFISTADDGIVIKNAIWLGCKGEMKNIEIEGCEIISRTNSIKIGTETTFDIKNIRIKNCRFLLPDLYPYTVSGIAIESADGSKISNVTAENITVNNCSCPIFIRLCNRNRAAEVTAQSANAIERGIKAEKGASAAAKEFNHKGEIESITIKNLTAEDTEIPIMICGYRQNSITKRVKNVTLENIKIKNSKRPYTIDRRLFIPEYAKEYPEANRFRNLPSYALFIRHAENVTIKNFAYEQVKTWKKERYIKDLKNN